MWKSDKKTNKKLIIKIKNKNLNKTKKQKSKT
jgi:hypothetical protein